MISERSFTIQGVVAGNPEVKATKDGRQFGTFFIKVNSFRDGKPEQAFFECECWNQSFEKQFPKAHRGQEVKVNGYITSEQYTDKNNHVRLSYKLRATSVQVDSMSQAAADVVPTKPTPQPAWEEPQTQTSIPDITEDDLPF